MYHRIYFNLFCILLCLMEVILSRYTTTDVKMKVMTAIVCVFTAYCYIVRPYRSGTANAILCLCMIGLTIQVVLVQCVVAGYS